MRNAAVLAFGGACRMVLERDGGPGPTAAWLMCNPSKADAEINDPTARRVMHFSAAAGCPRTLVGNVFPLRTPYPADLWKMIDRGQLTDVMIEANLDALTMIGAQADVLFVATGPAPFRRHPDLAQAALRAFAGDRPLSALGLSLDDFPLHPLARGRHAIRNDTEPQPWEPKYRAWDIVFSDCERVAGGYLAR